MLKMVLDSIAGALTVNLFVPFITLTLYFFIIRALRGRAWVQKLDGALRFLLALLLLPALHFALFLVTFCIWLLFSKVTGRLYWAA
jgi:hypothetical protein